jgi:glycogen operon protein
MLPDNWDEELARAIAVFYNGGGIGKNPRGRPIEDSNFLLCFNSNSHPATFTLPGREYSSEWELVLDTAGDRSAGSRLEASAELSVEEKAVVILRAYAPPSREPDHTVAASLALLKATQAARLSLP